MFLISSFSLIFPIVILANFHLFFPKALFMEDLLDAAKMENIEGFFVLSLC